MPTWLAIVLALAGALAALWWHRRRARAKANALGTLARGFRSPHTGVSPVFRASGGTMPTGGMHASGETPAVARPRRRGSSVRHAPYVPDALLPEAASALPLFRRGPHRFARNLLASADDDHELRVFDYSASEERTDELAAVTVALFRSRVLHLPDAPFDSETPGGTDALLPPVRDQINGTLAVQGAGSWLAVYHRAGLVPDDKLESFVDDARRVHDLLAGVDTARQR